ncbi:hypothetical protein F5Y01DRAFT_36608 [Xylaria sp. FL0043]|nr:hypothetical protein F5Y01DRAFT_36608 [Xylaria sp. FL0043]
MGALSKIATIPILAIEVCAFLAITFNGAGPALEPPAHLGFFGRVAYYTFHRRFRDFFVPFYTVGFAHGGYHFLKGDMPGPLWLNGLFLLSSSWLWSLTMTRMEAIKYSNQPYTVDEEKLWTEGMTRREFLKRKRG